jgi:hypothetical protein
MTIKLTAKFEKSTPKTLLPDVLGELLLDTSSSTPSNIVDSSSSGVLLPSMASICTEFRSCKNFFASLGCKSEITILAIVLIYGSGDEQLYFSGAKLPANDSQNDVGYFNNSEFNS